MAAVNSSTSRSNQFTWGDYNVSHWPLYQSKLDALEDNEGDDIAEAPENPPVDDNENKLSFTLRHLKQGATGAVKTWPVAPVLLDYLVLYGGLLGGDPRAEKDATVLDMTLPPPDREELLKLQNNQPPCFNVLDLGAGTGYLGIGLALALNAHSLATSDGPRAKVMCTDMDKHTIKNMRHNLTANKITKTVRAEPLAWGEDCIDQPKFLDAVKTFFKSKNAGSSNPVTSPRSVRKEPDESPQSQPADSEDPILRITHLIGSDVHYGETTLEPLSSVVAAVKLRNPGIKVTLMTKERGIDSMDLLKSRIEDKIRQGIEAHHCGEFGSFSVTMRDVLHEHVTTVKILEC